MAVYFISHSTKDRQFVEEQLTELLTALGIEFWYSKENIQTGEHWERSIKSGLEASDGIILVMSPDSANSEWVKDEVHWGINNRPGRLIPILHKTCDLETFHIRLPRIQYIDFTTNESTAKNKLIRFLVNIEHEANSRIGIMNGSWQGLLHQDSYLNQGMVEYPVELRLKVSNQRKFEGSVTIIPPFGETYFRLTGGFLFERFIQFSYYSTDPGTIQFGAAVLELNPSGTQMSGKWIGFGAKSQAIVNGTVTINKVSI